jgi:biopolymer transport protein ExbB/TolQ
MANVSELDQKAISSLTAPAVGAILRAMERSASVVHEDFKGGLNGLAAIGPWFGLFATVVNIPAAFVGCGGLTSIAFQ